MYDNDMWTFEYILSQIFVVLAFICLAGTYLIKNKKIILILSCSSAVLFAINYLLLGAYTGTLINIVGLLRGIWFYIDESKGRNNNWGSLIVCALLILAGGVFTFSAWVDVLAIFAGLLYTYAIWQKNLHFYRWSAILGSICFITFNAINRSIFGCVCEGVMLIVEIIGIVKLYYRGNKSKKLQ